METDLANEVHEIGSEPKWHAPGFSLEVYAFDLLHRHLTSEEMW